MGWQRTVPIERNKIQQVRRATSGRWRRQYIQRLKLLGGDSKYNQETEKDEIHRLGSSFCPKVGVELYTRNKDIIMFEIYKKSTVN